MESMIVGGTLLLTLTVVQMEGKLGVLLVSLVYLWALVRLRVMVGRSGSDS